VLVFRSLLQGDVGYPLSVEPRRSLRQVARRLGVDELTVRARLEKLRRQGFLKGWHVFVNPNLLGVKLVQVLLSYDPEEEERVIRRLSALPNVAAIVTHIGRSMWLILICRNDKSTNEEVRTVERLAETKSSASLEIFFPKCGAKLSPTDVEIIAAFSDDPRKPFSDVATELGLSTRTVRRRLGRLVEERALFVIPAMDPGALEGALMADLLVEYSSGGDVSGANRELLSKLDRHLVRAQFGDSRYAFFNLFINKVSTAKEVLQAVRAIDGVRDARVDLVQSRLELFEHYYGSSRGLDRLAVGRSRAPKTKKNA
jgi:DNA-binding Lrp family transcriptional regulator